MPYITTTDVDAVLSSDVRQALFTDGGTYNTAAFEYVANLAEADVRSALKASGYEAPGSGDLTDDGTTGSFLKAATLGRFIHLAFDRAPNAIEITETMRLMVDRWQQIADGSAQVPGLEPSDIGAAGGVEFTESSVSVSGSSPQRTRRSEMDVW